jgi:hypothetical protein
MVSMAVRVVRRPGWLALVVLLAALLAVLGMAFSVHGQGVASSTPEPRGADAAADGVSVEAVAPVRSVGRPAVEPSPLGVHGSGELVAFGTTPNAAPLPALMRLGGHHASVLPRLRAALRPAVGDRAPPNRLSDL